MQLNESETLCWFVMMLIVYLHHASFATRLADDCDRLPSWGNYVEEIHQSTPEECPVVIA